MDKKQRKGIEIPKESLEELNEGRKKHFDDKDRDKMSKITLGKLKEDVENRRGRIK